MALCDTCPNAVLSDGQRCETCRLLGRERELPRGFVAYGWHSFASGALARMSVAHLIPESQVQLVRGGTQGSVHGPALCGAQMRGRGPRRDHPGIVFGEARRGERKWCERCFLAVAAREHLPTYSSRRTGVGNQYGRGHSGSGGTNTHVTCSCGWKNGSNTTKREQMRNFREHLLDVVNDGLFVIDRERYEPVVGGLWLAAGRLNPYGQADEESRRQLAGLVMGEQLGALTRDGYVAVRRKLMPLIPAAAR